MNINNRKGFTLVELLGVIVILGILVSVIVASVSVYLKKARDNYDDELENSLLLAGKDYYTDDSLRLPKNGDSNVVSLQQLSNLNFVNKDFIDAYGNKCSKEKSLVMVTNNNGNYDYVACLYCENSEKFSDDTVQRCDPVNINIDAPPEDILDDQIVCKIKKNDGNYVVYDKNGNYESVSNGFEAISKLKNVCDLDIGDCQEYTYKFDDDSEIEIYYANSTIYKDKSEAQAAGFCNQICSNGIKLVDGYDTFGSDYKKVVSTTESISNVDELMNVFQADPINNFTENTNYYFHAVKENAYNKFLEDSKLRESLESASNGKISTLSEYFNPSKKTKIVNSTNSMINHNSPIPDQYDFVLSESTTKSKVTIPSNLKMSQKHINQWGKAYSEPAEYGRVVLAEDAAKGKYKARYSNVGTFNGKKVDVVMTLTGFSGCKLKSGTSKCGIWFEPKVLEVYSLGVKRISVKYEFFQSGTNKPISVKGYSTYWDIDANQGIHFVKGTTGLYTYGSNALYVSILEGAPYVFEYNDIVYSGYDEKGAVTETFSGSVLNKTFTFMSGSDGDHSKVTSSCGSVFASTVPIGVSKEYVGSINSNSVLKKDQTVKFRIRYSNLSSSAKTLTITDNLSSNMTYKKGTSKFNDASTTNPTVSNNKLIWKKKISAFSQGYVTYSVKVKGCGYLGSSYATLKVGDVTFKSRKLQNLVVCSKRVDTECK